MEPNMLEVTTVEDFELFCSLFDLGNGIVFHPEMLKRTAQGLSYQTDILYYDDCYKLRIELTNGKLSIDGLNGLYEVDPDFPIEVNQFLDYFVNEIQEKYIKQKFLLADIQDIKTKFDQVYENKRLRNFDEPTGQAAMQVSYLANHSVFKLKMILDNAEGVVKNTIYETCIDILEKTNGLHKAAHDEAASGFPL